MDVVTDGAVAHEEVPLRNAMNEVLRDEYVADCERVVKKWNRTLSKMDTEFRVALPDRKFHRRQGIYAGAHFCLLYTSPSPRD